jgi:hypothetical protein
MTTIKLLKFVGRLEKEQYSHLNFFGRTSNGNKGTFQFFGE